MSRHWHRPVRARSGSATSATTLVTAPTSRSPGSRSAGATARSDPTSYRLAYPGGARDAETLVRNPRTGRLYIASKNVFGGALYAVPRHLRADRVNPLTRVGRVLPMATDGAFFPDGKHLVVRGYGSATVYAWPSLQPVATFDLPAQRQGEGIAVARGRVGLPLVGGSPVARARRSPLPDAVRRAMSRASPSPSPSPSAAPSSAGADPASPTTAARDSTSTDVWPWALGGLVVVGAILVLLRSLRPR